MLKTDRLWRETNQCTNIKVFFPGHLFSFPQKKKTIEKAVLINGKLLTDTRSFQERSKHESKKHMTCVRPVEETLSWGNRFGAFWVVQYLYRRRGRWFLQLNLRDGFRISEKYVKNSFSFNCFCRQTGACSWVGRLALMLSEGVWNDMQEKER